MKIPIAQKITLSLGLAPPPQHPRSALLWNAHEMDRSMQGGLAVEFLTYYFTLVVLLAGVMAAASCFSAFLVSRKRIMLLACGGFLCAFFDTAFMLQDDIAGALFGPSLDPSYLLGRTVVTILIGGTGLTFFWLVICDYVDEQRRMLHIAPAVVFLVGSFALLPFAGEGPMRFWFYSMRAFYIGWMLLFTLVRYLGTTDPVERCRLERGRAVLVAAAALVIGVMVEDALFFIVMQVESVSLRPVALQAERNYFENLLTLGCAAFACFYAFRALSLRFNAPPTDEGAGRERYIDDNLLVYGNRYNLTDREREVLRLILLGRDNQNIASTLTIALSTAKVYVHRILQKTEQPGRQALVQDFWKNV